MGHAGFSIMYKYSFLEGDRSSLLPILSLCTILFYCVQFTSSPLLLRDLSNCGLSTLISLIAYSSFLLNTMMYCSSSLPLNVTSPFLVRKPMPVGCQKRRSLGLSIRDPSPTACPEGSVRATGSMCDLICFKRSHTPRPANIVFGCWVVARTSKPGVCQYLRFGLSCDVDNIRNAC
ncbi:hypothetical protein BDV96DRAFT_590816 [Lophiotrema nucula]|uniref:Uncharacterized protein n=1 Tax=Lophiotrema nucula TaxID=690887 RepID=A0A6A5YH29_9PLEO|nr:hypothetical protein BDV96DRAFT_590816 [Lophiotrema nucula]